MPPVDRRIDGQNIIYHYFQKNVLRKEDEFSKELLGRLLLDLSIWIPTSFYRRLPIILPYVVRDPSCRGRRNGKDDEWGTANSKGFLRDDNSLIKGIFRSHGVHSPKIAYYEGLKLGKGFVASHIWGRVEIESVSTISSRSYILNSFVPNLVWLPVQLSKLTDREGSFAQRLLQAASHRIYRDIDTPEEISEIWNYLNFPEEMRNISIDVSKLNYFVPTDVWMKKRVSNLISEIDNILSINRVGLDRLHRVKARRYVPTLLKIPSDRRRGLAQWLAKYRKLIKSENN